MKLQILKNYIVQEKIVSAITYHNFYISYRFSHVHVGNLFENELEFQALHSYLTGKSVASCVIIGAKASWEIHVFKRTNVTKTNQGQ